MNIAYSVIQAEPGQLFIAETSNGLIHIDFGPDGLAKLTKFVNRWFDEPRILPTVVDSIKQIDEYLNGERTTFDIPYTLFGTDFQKKVWKEINKIKYAKTKTYGQLAKAVGRPAASRAVGAACGANPLGLVIPCHRVLGSRGRLTGFGGGLKWKQWLLDLENHKKE